MVQLRLQMTAAPKQYEYLALTSSCLLTHVQVTVTLPVTGSFVISHSVSAPESNEYKNSVCIEL